MDLELFIATYCEYNNNNKVVVVYEIKGINKKIEKKVISYEKESLKNKKEWFALFKGIQAIVNFARANQKDIENIKCFTLNKDFARQYQTKTFPLYLQPVYDKIQEILIKNRVVLFIHAIEPDSSNTAYKKKLEKLYLEAMNYFKSEQVNISQKPAKTLF